MLLRKQLRTGLHRAWCLDPAPQGQEKSAKTERSAGRALVINISLFQKVYNFLKESFFSEEIYKIPVHLSARKDVYVVIGKIWVKGVQAVEMVLCEGLLTTQVFFKVSQNYM